MIDEDVADLRADLVEYLSDIATWLTTDDGWFLLDEKAPAGMEIDDWLLARAKVLAARLTK